VPDDEAEAVTCHGCGHSYDLHGPACAAGEGCDCGHFRWVDPSPAPDVLGYHRPPQAT
jgi:hypothetical protein